MQITVHGETKYIPVSTITLQKLPEGETAPFHCLTCGNTINIIGGKVVKIYPILEPSNQVLVISTCKSCKSKLTFQDTDEVADGPIKWLLNPKEEMQSAYCYLGGGEIKSINKIIDYDIRSVYSYVLNTRVQLPFTSVCPNPECTLKYEFNQFS